MAEECFLLIVILLLDQYLADLKFNIEWNCTKNGFVGYIDVSMVTITGALFLGWHLLSRRA